MIPNDLKTIITSAIFLFYSHVCNSVYHVDNVVVIVAVVLGGSARSALAAGRASPPRRWCGARSRTSTTCAASPAPPAQGPLIPATSSISWKTGNSCVNLTMKLLEPKVRFPFCFNCHVTETNCPVQPCYMMVLSQSITARLMRCLGNRLPRNL